MPDDHVVFDAEPLVAHADGEPNSENVAEWIDAVRNDESRRGFVCPVTLTEVRYVLSRKYDTETADDYLSWLRDVGIELEDGGELWVGASEFVLEHNPSLGDAYVLAAAERTGGVLLAGADDDFDGIEDVQIERFRDDPA